MKTLQSKKVKKISFLRLIQPLNLEEEKQKFFFDPQYNPQFEYPETPDKDKLNRHGEVHDEFLPFATQILGIVLSKYGKESEYLEEAKGRLLKRDESVAIITNYLKENNLAQHVKITFSANYSARTALKRSGNTFTLQIRTPVLYRENSLQGMLNHEIGVHLFRWLNEMQQPWFQHRDEYDLHNDYLLTEEGLASLSNLMAQPHPYMWTQALNYWLVVEGSRSSFAQLNHKLKKYVDSPERRWRYCLKVERGVEDTSLPLVFTKSQIYFRGLIMILSWLHKNDFDLEPLFLGKVSLSDLPQAKKKSTHRPVLPLFLQSQTGCEEKFREIIELNELEDLFE